MKSDSFTLDKNRKDELIRNLRLVFEECDLNYDGILQKDEIQAIVEKHRASSVEAQIVALFAHCFDDIVALHKEGWFEKRDGITIGDLFLLEHILSVDSREELSEEKQKLYLVANNILKRVEFIWKLSPSLYGADNDPETSVRAIAIRRGNVGNCNFLATLASLAAIRPHAITDMISVFEDKKNLRINFPGLEKRAVFVQKPTIIELSLYGQLTRMGYWPCVMEKAFNEQFSAAEGEFATIESCFALLTGKGPVKIELVDSNKEKLVGLMESNVSVVISKDSDKTPAHPYTVLKVDKENRRVTLRDPFGPRHSARKSKESARPRAKKEDGIFSVSFDELLNSFEEVYVEAARD